MAYVFHDGGVEVALKTHEQAEDSIALVGKKVWTRLGLSYPVPSHVAISLWSPSPTRASSEVLDCWAKRSASEDHGTSLPSSLLAVFPIRIVSERESVPWTITLSRPQAFAVVFVKALCKEDYEAACTHSDDFEAWLLGEERILRRGCTFRIPGSVLSSAADTCEYELIMTEPCSVGFVDATNTEIVLTSVDACRKARQKVNEDYANDGGSPVDELDIDEDFLANSALSTSNLTKSDIPSLSSGWPERAENADTLRLRVDALSAPLSSSDGHTIYLRISDLNKMGLLSGDWAVAWLYGSERQRTVQVCVHSGRRPVMGSCLLSPVLIHNLGSGDLVASSPSIFLRATGGAPSVPLARSVTLARVASPITTLKVYEKSIVHGLRQQLSKIRLAVLKGDIICIGINTDLPIFQDASDPDNDRVWDCPGTRFVPYNSIAFYKVTELEAPSQAHDKDSLTWIESNNTALIQAGVANVPVPNVDLYMGVIPQMLRTRSPNPAVDELYSLVSAMARRHLKGLKLQLPILLKGVSGIGKFAAVREVGRQLGLHIQEIDCYSVVGDTDVSTAASLRVQFDRAEACAPCILVMRHLDAFAQSSQTGDLEQDPAIIRTLEECVEDIAELTEKTVIVIGTIDDSDRLSSSTISIFKHEIVFAAPVENERLDVLVSRTSEADLSMDVSLTAIATRSAALVANDIIDLIDRSETVTMKRALQHFSFDIADKETLSIKMAAYDEALSRARKVYSESIGAPKIPNVSWNDVGGLAHVKAEVLDTIQLPLDHPELFGGGLKKRSGVLLYGPPGTGKTLVAKAVATSCSLNFLSVKGPELLNMYIGESEANVRRIFQRARDAKPCVIFFDELDSVAPKRGNQGDSGGVMDRIVSQLLAELDGVASGSSADIFVIGATNRPDLLDPALLRPGRFDRMLYLGLSDTHEAQLQLLQALTRKFRLHPDLDLKHVAEQCAFNFTGADFYALCADAILKAMNRKAQYVDSIVKNWNEQPSSAREGHPYPLTTQYYLSELASNREVEVQVSQEDFEVALKDLVPSVSSAELEHYNRIQRQYSSNEDT